MSSFVIAGLVLVLLALAFALSALWQSSRRLALGLVAIVPLAAAGLYLLVGNPMALDPSLRKTPSTVAEAAAQLQKRLRDEPETFETLVALARSHMATGEFSQAGAAYAKAIKLRPDETDVPVEYAEALLRSSPDRRFPAQAVPLLERAVSANPRNERALFFLGMHQLQSGQPAQAAATWETLLPLLQPPAAAALREQVQAARAAAGLPALAEAEALLTVEVDVDGLLASQVRPGDVLFVYARGVDERGPPLAARRIEVSSLPMTVALTDADSPMPTATLGSQKQVQVFARLSHGGDATPASGDLEADPVQAPVGAGSRAQLVLNRTRP